MFETLDRLLEYHSPDAKAIVWAHNTHIGDARATDMIHDGMLNIGQIAREKYGEDNVVLVGFSSYRGSVIAGDVWDAPMRVMHMPEAREGSWEQLLHDIDGSNKMLITQNIRDVDTARVKRDHRAIGVVYNPDFEVGNYVTTDLPARYDVFMYLDQTHALEPLPVGHIEVGEVPETFPAGV
jgi:erythromycin esterase-like protein